MLCLTGSWNSTAFKKCRGHFETRCCPGLMFALCCLPIEMEKSSELVFDRNCLPNGLESEGKFPPSLTLKICESFSGIVLAVPVFIEAGWINGRSGNSLRIAKRDLYDSRSPFPGRLGLVHKIITLAPALRFSVRAQTSSTAEGFLSRHFLNGKAHRLPVEGLGPEYLVEDCRLCSLEMKWDARQ